jgi:hypothetical protein
MYAKLTKLNHGSYQVAGWMGPVAVLDILNIEPRIFKSVA